MNKKRNLILLTASFPFGKQETFLENELPILAEAFDKITILHSYNNGNKRTIPTNVNCIHTPLELNCKELKKSYFNLFSFLVWKEIFILLFVYKKMPSLGFFKTLFISISKGKKMQHAIEKHFQLNELNSSIHYSYWCDDHAIGLAFLNKKYNHQLKTVSRTHGWDVYFEVSQYNYLPLRSFIHNHLTHLFPISNKGKSYMEERWKIKNKITVSRLGVPEPPNSITNNIEAKSLPKFNEEQLSILNSQFSIISCSNLIPLKRIHLIIEALALIEDKPIRWVHFGDGPEFERLKTKAKELLPSNILVEWKGRVSNQTVLDFYAKEKPDLFINVSSSEGIPVSIMEAMSFGIPCIASNVGGNSEIVNDSNGKLLNSNPTVKELEYAIIDFFKNKDEIKSAFQKNALKTWEQEYYASLNYTNFLKQLNEL